MIPKLAIEKAIEGGWDGEWDAVLGPVKHWDNGNACGAEHVVLDPTFWQALGKALGWSDTVYRFNTTFTVEWKNNALHFYDFILTGTDTKPFWDKLLTNNT